MGPLSVSSSGRVGVSAGPVSVYGGGRRRGSGGGEWVAALFAIGLVVIAVMWPLSLWGHFIHLTPSWHELMNRHHAWMHEHYPLVGLRYVIAALLLAVVLALAAIPFLGAASERRAEREREAQAEYQRWLSGPPPTLVVPSRFTDRWFAENVPQLHPGQVPTLIGELRARGWKDDRISQRVGPYLDLNPHR
jgi:hypothetical protein